MKKMIDYLPPDTIRKQLQKVADSEEFRKSAILVKFLEFVVETTLAGREEEIKEHTIAVKALGRPKDFNPQLDAIVRIHATRLRRALSEYYHGPGREDLFIISIPKGTYIPHFALTKEESNTNGFSTDSEANTGTPQECFPEPAAAKPVLAVLPFHDLNPQPPDPVFITALGEELSLQLAKFGNLSVISFYTTRNLAFSRDLEEMKTQAGIDYILTGSVLLLNQTVKLNVQLTNVANSNIIWSDSFVRQVPNGAYTADSFDDVIGKIANNLADEHGIINRLDKQVYWTHPATKGPVSEAIRSYFDFTYEYDISKFESVVQTVEKAYQVAANNVLVVSILAKLYLDKYACGVEDDKTLLEKGMELATKAVGLNPFCQYAQKALAWGLTLAGNKHKSVEVIDNCITINPSASSTLSTMGLGLIMLGEYNSGYEMLMKSLRLNEHTSACGRLGLSLYHYKQKNYEESIRWLDRMSPFDIPFVHLLKAAISGNINGKLSEPDSIVVQLNGHKKNIIERIVLDPDLKKDILQGLALAG